MSSKTVGSQKEIPASSDSEDAKSLQQTQGGVGGVNLEAQRQQQNRQQELYTWLQASTLSWSNSKRPSRSIKRGLGLHGCMMSTRKDIRRTSEAGRVPPMSAGDS